MTKILQLAGKNFKTSIINMFKNQEKCIHNDKIDGEFQQRNGAYKREPDGKPRTQNCQTDNERFTK